MKKDKLKLIELKEAIFGYNAHGANLLLKDTNNALAILLKIKETNDKFNFENSILELQEKVNYLETKTSYFQNLKKNRNENFNSIKEDIHKLVNEAISYLN